MAKSFANRFLLMGLFSLLVFGNISSAMAAVDCQSCYGQDSMGYLPLEAGGGMYACLSSQTSVSGCAKLRTYIICERYPGSPSATFYQQRSTYTSCEHYVSSRTSPTSACETGNKYTATHSITGEPGGIYEDMSVTLRMHVCCDPKYTIDPGCPAFSDHPERGCKKQRMDYYNAVGGKYGGVLISNSCPSSTYTAQCTCNDGFKVQNQGTTSCNCNAYESGYSCYVASCTGTRQGLTTTFVGNHYISDDRKSCAACPTGTESTVSAANKIYYSGATGPVVWTGRVGEQIGNSAFVKIGVANCYQPAGAAISPNVFKDGNGNAFSLSQSCHYTE